MGVNASCEKGLAFGWFIGGCCSVEAKRMESINTSFKISPLSLLVKVVAPDCMKYVGWGGYGYQVRESSWDGSQTLLEVRLILEYGMS
jgi:hypothetical protein